MGQKVNPTGFRVGIMENWRSRWYAQKKDFKKFLLEDRVIRNFIKREYKYAQIPKVIIERTREQIKIDIHTARPGILIGRKGVNVEELKKKLAEITGSEPKLEISEIARPELDALLVAEAIAEQLEKRASFRRTIKRAASTSMQMGAQGIKIQLSGRIGGAEMARTEGTSLGKIPLQTLRADIDYGHTEAKTAYGTIGVKVWIYRGEYPKKE